MFSILTYNIHKGFAHFFRRFKLHAMREALIKQNSDIVFLQEVYGEHSRHEKRISKWPKQPQLEYLAHAHWPEHIYAKNATYREGHHGNGIMTKFSILEWENINIAANKFSSRSLLHAKLQLEEKHILHIICVHLGLFEAEREKQLGTLSDRIKSHVPDNEPLIIAGDFNDWRRRAEEHLCETLQLRDAFLEYQHEHPKTFPALYPTLAVDRIYYRRLKLIDCSCLEVKPWRYLSDHLPLKARFSI